MEVQHFCQVPAGIQTHIERPALVGVEERPARRKTKRQPIGKSLRRLMLRQVAEAGRKWAALLEGPPAIRAADLGHRRPAQKLDLHEQP